MPTTTAFVLGAGASKEVKLPLGSSLTGTVADLLNFNFQLDTFGELERGDIFIYEALLHRLGHGSELGQHLKAAELIRNAMHLAPSIAVFLDSHRGYKETELCGKLAIVRGILTAEYDSSLMVADRERTIRQDHVAHTWYNKFWRLFSNGCDSEELISRPRSIVFVIFNYDRCIQHFIFNALGVLRPPGKGGRRCGQ